MPLLIDGHNLIGQMTTIRLGDDDDEAQLVQLLRRYVNTVGGRVVVVFDGGVPNHPQRLEGQGVEVEFVRPPADADGVLIQRLGELRQSKSWQIVTSDREVALVARRRGVAVISSQEFARRLERGLRAPEPPRDPDAKPRLKVTDEELPEWLALFGVDPADADAVDLPIPPRKDFSSPRAKRRKKK